MGPTLSRHLTQVMISPAQRYSLVINTNQTTAESFWLRARMLTHCWKDPDLPGPGADEVKAIIQYTSSSHAKTAKGLVAQPSSRNWNQGIEVQCKDMNTTSYVPALYRPAPAVVDHSYYIRSNLEIGDGDLNEGFSIPLLSVQTWNTRLYIALSRD